MKREAIQTAEPNAREALKNLEGKIAEAQGELKTAAAKSKEFQDGMENRLRDDAVGGRPYALADRRTDGAILAGLNQEADVAGDVLLTLEGVLPEVRLAAAREGLQALDRDLSAFDQGPLAEAMGAFRTAWNAAVEARLVVESAYGERAVLVNQYMEVRKGLPAPQSSQTWPTASALCSSVGFKRVIKDADFGELKDSAFLPKPKANPPEHVARPELDPGPALITLPKKGEPVTWPRY